MSFQVAAQQGSYLADCFNRMEDCEKNPEGPLRFRGEGRHRFRPFRSDLFSLKLLVGHIHMIRLDSLILSRSFHCNFVSMDHILLMTPAQEDAIFLSYNMCCVVIYP